MLMNDETLISLLAYLKAHPPELVALDTESSAPLLPGVKSRSSKKEGKSFINVFKSQLTGLSLSLRTNSTFPTSLRDGLSEDGQFSCYLPIAHRSLNIDPLLLCELHQVLSSPDTYLVVHNLKWEMLATQNSIFPVPQERTWDTLLICWLLGYRAPGKNPLGLKQLTSHFLGAKMSSFEEVSQGKPFQMLTPRQAHKYATDDARYTLQLFEFCKDSIDRSGISEVYWKTERPMAVLLGEMESIGIHLNRDKLWELQAQLSPILDGIQNEWCKMHPDVSISSPKQLSSLFESGYWPTSMSKQTASGYSTSKDILQSMLDHSDLSPEAKRSVELKLEYNFTHKALSTYIRSLSLVSTAYDVPSIHPQFHQTGTVTGRLSSSNPNAQNFPAHTQVGKAILGAFCTPDGWLYQSADFSQLELRLLAHYAGGVLMDSYLKGEDIHQRTADTMGIERHAGKTLNFAVVYGAGPGRLSAMLGIGKEEAIELLESYDKAFPEIPKLRTNVINAARKRGYIKTIGGRYGFFKEMRTAKGAARFRLERQCFNLLFQGGASDLVKRVMLRCKDAGLQIVSQIHDDIIIITEDSRAAESSEKLYECMTKSWPELRVPLETEVKTGRTFADLKG